MTKIVEALAPRRSPAFVSFASLVIFVSDRLDARLL